MRYLVTARIAVLADSPEQAVSLVGQALQEWDIEEADETRLQGCGLAEGTVDVKERP